MCIIATGMDNTGKTQLVKQLAQYWSSKVVKSPGPEPYEMQKDWIVQQLAENAKTTNIADIVYDRFAPFEEIVYGTILREGPLFTITHPLVEILKFQKPIIVYTRPSREVIFRFGNRAQMEGVIEKKEKLLEAWDELIFKLMVQNWKVLVYDWTIPKAFNGLIDQMWNITRKELIRYN